MLHWIKDKDNFGVPVSLTYKADPFIKSTYGGSLTLAARVGILIMLLLQCASVINKSATISTGFYRRDIKTDPTEYHLTVANFGYAVRVEYENSNINPDVAANLD